MLTCLLPLQRRMGASGSKQIGTIHTQPGSISSCSFDLKQGTKGICQDTLLACEGFLLEQHTALVAVFDGHGNLGHEVAAHARDWLPIHLTTALAAILQPPGYASLAPIPSPAATAGSEDSGENVAAAAGPAVAPAPAAPIRLQPGEISGALWEKGMKEAFRLVDEDLKNKDQKRAFDSGSTSVVVLHRETDLIVSHIGDARAVLGTVKDGKVVAEALTEDHKAGNPKEKARIHAAGGKVMNFYSTIDRVFAPGKNEPGLAVARAFGDFDLKDWGVSSEPDVKCHRVRSADKFVIIASDGLWDVLSNTQAVDVVVASKKASAANKLIKAALAKYSVKRGMRDDISVVVYYL